MGAAAVLVTVAGLLTVEQGPASADANAPPTKYTDCPAAQAPPPGYPDGPPSVPHVGPPSVSNPYTPPATASDPGPTSEPYFPYNGYKYSGFIPYEVPFTGTIGSKENAGGTLTLTSSDAATQPNIVVPHIYAAVCGVVSLPTLKGDIPSGAVNIASDDVANGTALPNVVNVYIGGVEALPAQTTFGELTPTLLKTPAANGGLDLTIAGSTTAILDSTGSPGDANTLGTKCPLVIPSVPLTTVTSGSLSGRPVTGPFHAGVALAVGNNFAVPAVVTSATCPAALALTVNKLLGLPAAAGRASLTVPITFNFEIDNVPPYDTNIRNG